MVGQHGHSGCRSALKATSFPLPFLATRIHGAGKHVGQTALSDLRRRMRSFALVAVNMDTGEYARVVHGHQYSRLKPPRPRTASNFNSRAASSDQDPGDRREYLSATCTVRRTLRRLSLRSRLPARLQDIDKTAEHVITSPRSIDFIDPLRAPLETGSDCAGENSNGHTS